MLHLALAMSVTFIFQFYPILILTSIFAAALYIIRDQRVMDSHTRILDRTLQWKRDEEDRVVNYAQPKVRWPHRVGQRETAKILSK